MIVILLTTVDMSRPQLAIGVGAYRAVAVSAQRDRSWQPVLFDGQPWLPAGVHRSVTGPVLAGPQAQQAAAADPAGYLPDPIRRISADAIMLGSGPISGVDLVAAVLRRVLVEARRQQGPSLPQVTVVVPPRWGPSRRALLRQAAQLAGIDDPVLVPAAQATASSAHIDIAVAGWAVVCDLGTRAHATVIRRTTAGFDILAELDADAAGDRIDEVLAAHLGLPHTIDPPAHRPDPASIAAAAQAPADTAADTAAALVASPTPVDAVTGAGAGIGASARATVRAAKEAVWTGPVLLPRSGAQPAILVTADHVHAAAAQVLPAAATLLTQAIRAAEVPAETGAGVILVGGTAAIPGVADLVAAATGLPTRVLPRPDIATVAAAALNPFDTAADDGVPTLRRQPAHGLSNYTDGAGDRSTSHPTTASTPGGPAAQQIRETLATWPRRTARRLVTLKLLFGPVLVLLLSVLLLALTLKPHWIYTLTFPAPVSLMNAGALPVAVICVLTAAAAGAAIAAVGPTPAPVPTTTTSNVRALERRSVTTGLTAAVAVGISIVIGSGLLFALVYYDNREIWWFFFLLIGWTVLPALPAAAGIASCRRAITRGAPTPPGGWALALSMPCRAAALGPAAMAVMTWAITDPYPDRPGSAHRILQAAAVALGVATACLLADRLLPQALTAVPVAALFYSVAAYADGTLAGILGLIWAFVATTWWHRRAGRLNLSRPIRRAARMDPQTRTGAR